MTPPPDRTDDRLPGQDAGAVPRRSPGVRERVRHTGRATRAARPDDRRRTFLAPPPFEDIEGTEDTEGTESAGGAGGTDNTGGSGGPGAATTWWGHAWVEALEKAALDPARLGRGRRYAARGRVAAVTVTPGRITASVQGGRARPYRTEIRLRTLSDESWELLLATAAARPEHIAALLDKDVPRELAEVAELLPTAGDLVPDCSCPDDGYPCKHAAALCYQAARLLDEDPFVLFLMRGRSEHDILAELTRRHADHPAPPPAGPPPATVPAHTASAPRRLPPLPPPFPPPERPGRPPSYPHAPGAPDPMALDLLAGESAVRAHALLAEGTDPVAGLSVHEDAVRLAAAHPGSGLTASTRALYRDLAGATGRTPTELARAVAAWRQGGRAALAVLEEAWDPPAGPFDRARPALIAARLPGAAERTALRPWRNRLSGDRHQLRLGRDGLWYGYESEPGAEDWWPRGSPGPDPCAVLAALLGG
ncbi:SWIM zinc finger family protein [Streptomyces sp. NPDC000594]|uniref:SWIM zinc finger family protein n=1 Tax=Streptomyces sp. NPDC000594 TaxID=3154261 RepID=UPI00332922CA